jgi:hypothetical protein
MAISYNSSVVASNLVLCLDAANTKSYPGSGTTWTDLSNINTGTLTNGPTYSGTNNGSILFDGTNDFVSIPNNAALQFTSTQAFTLSVWMRPTVLQNKWVGVVTKSRDSANAWYGIWLDPSNRITWGGFPNNLFGPTATTGWQNVVISQDATNKYIYVNGSLSLTSSGVGNANGSNPMYVGRGTVDECFGGNVSNVSVYNRLLSADEVAQNFNALRGRYGI